MAVYSYGSQCRGKVPYVSRKEAKLVLRMAQGKATRNGFNGKVEPYACEHCGYFHLGHRP